MSQNFDVNLPVPHPRSEADFFANPEFGKGLPRVPRLALGTAGLGGVWGTKDENESVDVLHDAWTRGFLLTDTSPNYANAENVVGNALRKWTGAAPILTTKTEGYKHYEPGDGEQWIDSMTRQYDESVKRFGRPIDGLAMHDANSALPSFEVDCPPFVKKKKAVGEIKLVGMGGSGPDIQLRQMATGAYDYIITFKRICAISLQAMTDVIPAAQKHNTRVLVGSAVFMGLLGGKYDQFIKEPPSHMDPVFIERAKKLKVLGDKAGISLSQLSLRFVLSVPGVDFVLAGCGRPSTWQDSLTAYEAGPLKADLFADVWHIAQSGAEPMTGG